jgi:cytochrome c-type biogenesis protein CcmF
MPWVVATISASRCSSCSDGDPQQPVSRAFLAAVPPVDGRGLNPLLPELYMAIHPPMPVPRLHGHEHSVRLWHGGAGQRGSWRTRGWSPCGGGPWRHGCSSPSVSRSARCGRMRSWAGAGTGAGIGGKCGTYCPGSQPRAFLHSVNGAGTAGDAEDWNVSLVIVTFFLTIFGHVQDPLGHRAVCACLWRRPQLAWLFTGLHDRDDDRGVWPRHLSVAPAPFLATSLIRGHHERPRSSSTTGSCCSARSSCCSPRWFPTLSEAVRGERLTVGAPFFDKWLARSAWCCSF